MANKPKPDDGVALHISDLPASREDGVAVSVPKFDADSESKSPAKSAASTKEK